jgi:hypothetical protein
LIFFGSLRGNIDTIGSLGGTLTIEWLFEGICVFFSKIILYLSFCLYFVKIRFILILFYIYINLIFDLNIFSNHI